MLDLEAEWLLKTKYPNCRHNFGRTRPVARFGGLTGPNTFLRGKDFCFYRMFKTHFLSTAKFRRRKKDLGGNCSRIPPVSAVLGRNVPRKSSIGSIHVCSRGWIFWKAIFNSQHKQHLQIVQINYKYFRANTHNRLIFFNQKFLNELNKSNWVVNHCHLIDGDYVEMS